MKISFCDSFIGEKDDKLYRLYNEESDSFTKCKCHILSFTSQLMKTTTISKQTTINKTIKVTKESTEAITKENNALIADLAKRRNLFKHNYLTELRNACRSTDHYIRRYTDDVYQDKSQKRSYELRIGVSYRDL